MEFLCPNCQKQLTVPEQYAGTLMKCPLCQSTFTAPALPPKPAPLSPAAAVPPPPPPSETYGIKAEAPLPNSTTTAAVSGPPPGNNRTAPKPPPGGLPSAAKELHPGFSIPLSPQVLPWIAPAALALVFLLQVFFPWVGYYWTGTGMLTQGGWGSTFGFYSSPDETLWRTLSGLTPKEAVGMNLLLIPYLLLFLLALALAVASAVLPHAHIKLPPHVEPLLRWRWALTAVVILFSFLILCAVLISGFTLENKAWDAAQTKANEAQVSSDAEKTQLAGKEYKALGVQRTSWLRLAFVLQLLAVLAAALTFWLDYRGPARPVPRLDLRW